ncbi:MAG: NAD(P)/FAD-dependent oxidoreductase [Treponema sp.]|nr:NAD(P)/FAD-dependent oxidoreductase [Treponema sp.]
MKKIVVIGAGIAGLSAAIYALRSGFDVTLCEQHFIAGGTCTSWRRKGYLFEGAVHWLTGSSSKTELYQVWKETGALDDDIKVLLSDPFAAVEYNGQTLNLYRNIDKTIKQFTDKKNINEQLIVLSPNDKKILNRLLKDVKAFSNVQMPVFDIKGVKSKNPKRFTMGTLFKMLPAFPVLNRLKNISSKQYIQQFEHKGLRRLFNIVPDEYSAISIIGTLATLNIGDGGYPEGGSLAMTERMVKTFTDLGGKLLLKTKVKKVNIENGITTGVTLDNDSSSIINADAVIVTQETIAAVNQLFDTPLEDKWVKDLCSETKPVACTFIGIGVKTEIPHDPIPSWELTEPVLFAGEKITEIGFYNYSGFKGYAPDGCTSITTALMGDTYDFWKKAKQEGRYDEEKQNIADKIKRVICQKYPQMEGNIEVIDVATPLTYERYTGAYRGSWMSIASAGEKMKSYPGFIENICGLYFAGHRLSSPGGLPVALFTGRQAAQMVCRQFDVVFN